MTTGDPSDILTRFKSLLPDGWFARAGSAAGTSASPTPITDAVAAGAAAVLAWAYSFLGYAQQQTRIQTSTDGWPDLAALDFFGEGQFPRFSGETDAAYSERILANILPTSATRVAVAAAIHAVVGTAPRITELWRPSDTGCWDGVGSPHQGTMYWDVDTSANPGRWSARTPFQAFVDTPFPSAPLLGNAQVPFYDSVTYWDTAGSAFIDIPGIPTGLLTLINAILNVQVEGTQIWLRFANPLVSPKPATISAFDSTAFWNEGGSFWA